jgi:hypothetical protein
VILSAYGAKTDSISRTVMGVFLGIALLAVGSQLLASFYESGDYSLYMFLVFSNAMSIVGTIFTVFSSISLGLALKEKEVLPNPSVNGFALVIIGAFLFSIGIADFLSVSFMSAAGLLPEEIYWYHILALSITFNWIFLTALFVGAGNYIIEKREVAAIGFLAGLGIAVVSANFLLLPISTGNIIIDAGHAMGRVLFSFFGVSLAVSFAKPEDSRHIPEEPKDYFAVSKPFEPEAIEFEEEREEKMDEEYELDL